jgi:hypothetical protein
MADKKISELTLATPEETDVIPFVDISDTTMGLSGTTKKATKADLKGVKGDNATVDVGTTTTGNAGTNASVINNGTTQNAVFDFTIPRGDKGETGDDGACVESVAFIGNDMVFTLDDASTVTLVDAKTDLKGDTGAQVESVAFVGNDMVFTLDDATTITLTGALTSLKGDTGKGITSITKTNTVGLVDTYTITYSDNTTSTFDVTNGAKGDTGDIGIDWQGAWSAGTYTITQAVSHNGSSWICTATSTTEEPSISATDWDLIALKGTDGAGSGDISGSGVENEIAYFTAEKTIDNLPVATYPSLTELSYIKGLTSAVQSQINGKISASSTDTLTNKTIDANGTGNSITNLEVADFASGVIDTDLSSVSASDNTIPSAKAVKTYVDNNSGGGISVGSTTSTATPSIDVDTYNRYSITALETAITSVTITGTPTNFQELIIRIKDNGTARAIAWGSSFEAKGVALPLTTVASKVLTVKFIYDTVTSKWGCVAYVNEA